MGLFSGVGKAISGLTGAITGNTAAGAATGAGRQQASAIMSGLREQRRQVKPAIKDLSRSSIEAGKYFSPYRRAGEEAIFGMQGLLEGDQPSYAAPTAEEVASSPATQFRMEQAQRALEMGAAAKGGLFGGGHQRQLAEYMQGLASQEYDLEAKRRLQAAQFQQQQQQQQLTGYQALSGMGLGATGQAAGIRERLGQAKAGIRTGSGAAGAAAIQAAGQARASGALAASQARQQAMGQIMRLGGTAAGAVLGGSMGAQAGGAMMSGAAPGGGTAYTGGIPQTYGMGYSPSILSQPGF